MARTAVVAGTATAVSNRVSRRQARKWSAHEEQHPQQAYPQQGYPPQGYPQQAYPQQGYPPPPAAPAEDDLTAQLDRLTVMRDRGQLTEQEFAAAKARLLGL